MSQTTYYGLTASFIDGETIYSGAEIGFLHKLVDSQLNGMLQLLGRGVVMHPNANAFKVAAGAGLSVTVQPGIASSRHTTYGGVFLGLSAVATLTGLAANSTLYIFASIEVTLGGNDSRATGIPKFIASLTPTLDGGVLLAKVTTSGAGVTAVEDMREKSRIESLDLFGPDDSTTSALVWGYLAGRSRDGSSILETAAGTVALTANATNYVEVEPTTGVVSANTVGFTASRVPLRKLTTNATRIIKNEDARTWARTPLSASEIPSGIDAAKIGGGNVSNTEFGYLDGVNAPIQNQLNGKSDSGHGHTSGSISDFEEAVFDAVAAILEAGSNITLSPNDGTNKIGIAASGSIAASLARDTAAVTTASLAHTATDSVQLIPLGKAAYVLKIATDAPAWVRLYSTPAYRTADAGRAITSDPVGESGVLAEVVTTSGNLEIDLVPMLMVSSLEAPPVSDIAIAVTNLSGATQTITVTITKITVEI